MTIALMLIGSLVALSGAGVALSQKPLPWLDGQTARPVPWGLGYLLLGTCIILMGVLLGRPAELWVAPLLLLVAALALIALGSRARPPRN